MILNFISKLLGILLIATVSCTVLSAQNTEEEEKTPEEIAFEMSERLEGLLNLEPHQTFYVDSTLQHDMKALHDEITALEMSGTMENLVYRKVQERWFNQIDSSFRKIMTEYQWLIYRRDSGKLSKDELKQLKAMEKAEKAARKTGKQRS
ncbi:MAG TPA: hypothetical protein IAC04_01755 [Candidatus Coprenecus stercoravium]|uniref:Uncharacterized protein n=1 Tax=Candidatus Coprenecus stercoravium TaxID=2840735 RepID=A0A9D2GND2_9BACT|nr:hypothetical protein [Candidatus Coprenecus stercoravium]